MFKRNTPQSQSLTGFRHDNEKKAQRKKTLLVLVALVLLIVVFHSPLEGVFSGVSQYVARPFFIARANVVDYFSITRSYFSSKKTLMSKNAELRSAIDLLLAEAYSREVYRKENEALKSVLGRDTTHSSLLLSRVLASPGRAPYDTLIIDAGSNLGVVVGTPVQSDGNFVIGEVTKVYAASAIVTLYSSSGNELPVTVGSSSIPTIAYGVGGGNFRIILPKGILVLKRDVIEITSLTPLFAGVVEEAYSPEGSSLQEIYFKFPMNVHELRFVYLDVPTTPV